MTTKSCVRAAALIALAAVPATGQTVVQYGPADAQQQGISVVAFDPVSIGAPVIDAPYSAEAVTEVTQVLADGNRIERRTTASIARASDGRTRREQQGYALGGFVGQSAQPIVTITDPRTGTHITLNYDLKVAFRMKPEWVAGQRVEGGATSWTFSSTEARGGMVIQERGASVAGRRVAPPPPPPAPPAPLDVFTTFDAPVIMTEPIGVATAATAAGGGETKMETLEPRSIEGLRAEGTRVTVTIAAGAVGNTLPIEVIRERWFSPELQVVLMTRSFDPRFGETVYRLTNLLRAEPSADLFKVPADFRIEDTRP